MPSRPLFRSRLVAALAKRTLLASSSAFRRSSAVRSGALLNINALVYHRVSQPVREPRDQTEAGVQARNPSHSHNGPIRAGSDPSYATFSSSRRTTRTVSVLDY